MIDDGDIEIINEEENNNNNAGIIYNHIQRLPRTPRSPILPNLFVFPEHMTRRNRNARPSRPTRPLISSRFRHNMRTLAATLRRYEFEDNYYPPGLSSLPQVAEESPEEGYEQIEDRIERENMRAHRSVLTQLIINPECQMFASFTSRAQSFLSYPMRFSGEMTIELLAQCCIFATGNDADVCCASCNTTFSGLSEDDNRRTLAIRHINANVECNYLKRFIYEGDETPGTALVRLMREEREYREQEERQQQQVAVGAAGENDEEGHADKRTLCPVCKFNGIQSLNVPCGHGFCNDCLMRIPDSRCSYCRSEVQASYRIHFY